MQVINKKGIDLIKKSEGLKLKAYLCSGGKWTIGYGHTHNVFSGMVIPEAKADEFLKYDLEDAAKAVSGAIRVPLTENQFAALGSFAFNFGGAKLRGSTLAKKINGGASKEEIMFQFRRWIHVKKHGKWLVEPGLVTRRENEIQLYFSK